MSSRRPYSQSHTENSYGDYSDDFSEVDDLPPARSAPDERSFPVRARGRGQAKGRGRGRGQGHHSHARSDIQMDLVTKRLLSANMLRRKELQNEVEDMKKKLKEMIDENKLYKRLQRKQEKALEKFEDTRNELPQMISGHNNEVRSLKEQLRRMREKYDKTDCYLKDAEDELERANAQAKKYRALSDQKNLGERSDLDRRLTKAELTLEEKQSRIKELERHLDLVKKNHRQELRTEHIRTKKAQEEIQELRDSKANLETMIKEKEKMLEAKNIYSQRFLKPSSHNGTPAESPSPWRQNLKKKSESMTDLTPRDKARAYEDKRKAEDKKKLRLPTLPPSSQKSLEKPPKPQKPSPKRDKEDREKEASDNNNVPDLAFNSVQRQDSEAEFWRRQEERYKQDQSNRETQDSERRRREQEEREQAQFREQHEKLQRELQEKERAERERREADERDRRERERREKEEREEKEREEREREERERREAEEQERERREKEEQERDRKQQEHREQEKLENEARQAEERRKKDELLRRLQHMDNKHSDSQASGDPFAPAESKKTGKDLLFLGTVDSGDSSPNNKKDYSFTRSVENMHRGKPAHDDVSVPYIDRQRKLKAANEDADVGGYQPSFTGPIKTMGSTQKKPVTLFNDADKPAAKPAAGNSDKKSKLMANLFGSQTASNSSAKKDEGDDLFLNSKLAPAKQPAETKRSSGFPWDNPAPAPKENGTSAQRESSALFGGGAAIVDDDIGINRGTNSMLLPRRPRQVTTTFSSKPAVMAVDDFDDDIEEVVL